MSWDNAEIAAAKTAGKMEQITDNVRSHYTTILNAWNTDDPDRTLPGSGYDRSRGSGISDPTANAEIGAHMLRIRLLQHVADTTLQLGELVADLGYDTDAAVAHVRFLADVDTEHAPYPARGSMRSLLAIHRGWWQTLHDTVMFHASSAEGAAEAAAIVDYITERNEHRLAHQLGRAAKRSRELLVRPTHPKALRQKPCPDPLGRGCERHLPPGDGRSACGACRTAKSRQKEEQPVGGSETAS